jgi:Family of unknown function (DUF6188)
MDQTIVRRLEQLRGAVVEHLLVDHALTLALVRSGNSGIADSLRIEGGFGYRSSTGTEHIFADDYQRSALGPALDLFGQTVAAVAISPEGDLTLDFGSGARMCISMSLQFEAWSLSAPGVATLAAPPGGRTPIWPSKEYGSAAP